MRAMNQPLNDKERAELDAWRDGPWVLKSHHDALVARLRDQLTKALRAVAELHRENEERKSARRAS